MIAILDPKDFMLLLLLFVLGRPRSGTRDRLQFQPNGLQCTTRGLTTQKSSVQDGFALGRQTAGKNVLVNPLLSLTVTSRYVCETKKFQDICR
ncbi:MAG TPA: hypothetical protein VG759_04810, partial [Candidatus Angelobacter sp.]|nr:hypothetical protein [Candidatus Angelobacter sp.]